MVNVGTILNGELIERLMLDAHLTVDMLVASIPQDLSRQTLARAIQGVPVSRKSGILIAEALGVTYRELLPQSSAETTENGRREEEPWPEWRTEEILSEWITASNGLQYRLMKMRHCEIAERFGRGKLYDLRHLGDDARNTIRHSLSRHAEICQKLFRKPGVPVNLSVLPGQGDARWLVVDEWIEGETLERRMKKETLSEAEKKRLLKQIAETLALFHEANILRRELSPRFILLREGDNSVVLTDFELGKLFEGSRTVSNDQWRDDPYRAPEVETGEIASSDYRSDLYSWGRIAVELLSGWLPKPGQERLAINELKQTKAVKQLLLDCTQIAPSKRADDMLAVLNTIKRWK